jgi:hydroxypyruvate reductase
MKPDVLLTQEVTPALTRALQEQFNLLPLYTQTDTDRYLEQHAAGIRAVVTGGARGLSREMMARFPALEIVAVYGVGTDAVDLDYARSRGIHVTNTPDVLTEDVADLAIGLLLATLRGICVADRHARAGHWGGLPLAHRLSGKRVGIVGLGRVGSAIAKRLSAFDCKISYCNTRINPLAPYSYVATIEQLAQENEILVLAAAAGNGQPLIGQKELETLGSEGVLINIARGKLIDEEALVKALQNGLIAAAGLDVFVNEPHIPAALLQMDNVVLQPHRGSATVETRIAMGELVMANLVACFAGKPLPSSVTG